MNTTQTEVLKFIEGNDVKFIRLNFCDIFGYQKNISIMSGELEGAFKEGVSFDAHAIKGFRDVTRSDLLLHPDPSTLSILPWRPGSGRVARFYCDIKNPDGTPFSRDSRYLLKQVLKRAEKMGYACKVGAECEFYLFKTDEDGNPTDITLDNGGYLDISPLDKGEDIRREICLTLEEMGIRPESSHHEQGQGQNEVVFRFGGALECADNLQSFKSVVKAIAARNGLFASFMPKPILEAPGSGLHINISLTQNGRNIFKNTADGEHSATVDSFIAGILSKIPEITLFLNPLSNSYERFGEFEAPKYVSWSHQNRSQLIRIPAAIGEKVRLELRSPDPAVNPYLAFALIIAAGLDGIEKNLPLSPAVNEDLYTADESILKSLSKLPESLRGAIALAENNNFIKSVIGEEMLMKHINIKKEESQDFEAIKNKSDFYKERYFNLV
ncbi:MAG: glutamine synthetase family protein [Oscillospiraceae bacterium]|nr:glutamine synthetase family protein [Oscillospiraceae bacterium]